MRSIWNGFKSFLKGNRYLIFMSLFGIGAALYFLWEPPLAPGMCFALPATQFLCYLFPIPLSVFLCISTSVVALLVEAITWAWVPFVLGTLLVIPKLLVLHLGPVEQPFFHFLLAHAFFLGTLPGVYFGWKISRAAKKKRGKGDSKPDGI